MYSTCIHCNQRLGRNESVESFAVGRRLAFDAARGRLWAVCAACGRWNLSPVDERFEAIEECERLFRDTPLRASSGEIGLARLRDGVELVRVGKPERAEFAAWRYADQFARRRKRNVAMYGAASVGVLALFWGAPALGLYTGGVATAANVGYQAAFHWYLRRKVQLRVHASVDGEPRTLELANTHIHRTRLIPRGDDDFALEVSHLGPGDRLHYDVIVGLRHLVPSTVIEGDDALRAAGAILTRMNGTAGSRRSVADAVAIAAATPDASRVFAEQSRTGKRRLMARGGAFGDPYLQDLVAPARLALEMLTHEEQERRALDGELAVLERAWREAEEIAAISDDMFLPSSLDDALARARRVVRG